ncbi:MAG: hypothetical protein JW955_17935 [Sedimentisphaerales bacterium]|nr:hypothetical protein [Sedimentisphaerales bacterium]
MSNEIQADYNSGNVLYAVIRNPAGQVWCVAAQVFETWGAAGHTAADYDVPMIDTGGSHYIGAFDSGIPAGSYAIQVFRQVGAAPVDGDPLVSSRQILWTGSGELTAAKILANPAVMDKVTGRIDYYDDDGQTLLLSLAPCDTQGALIRMAE